MLASLDLLSFSVASVIMRVTNTRIDSRWLVQQLQTKPGISSFVAEMLGEYKWKCFVTFLFLKMGKMQIKTVTNILSSAHESLADFKSSASLKTL